jgi:hypothetical protein
MTKYLLRDFERSGSGICRIAEGASLQTIPALVAESGRLDFKRPDVFAAPDPTASQLRCDCNRHSCSKEPLFTEVIVRGSLRLDVNHTKGHVAPM